MKKHIIITAVLASLFSASVLAHGYVTKPASRAANCKLNNNPPEMCGHAKWEPQSIETLSGFPGGKFPPDGSLASGGIERFIPLDLVKDKIWTKEKVKPGKMDFEWTLTVVHSTRNWRYYITKQDWNHEVPLNREAFESEPFCYFEDYGRVPPYTVTHQCEVPERKGYQIIYAVWEIADTPNSFYQVIDADFN